jgi:hypothetical protein
VISPGDELSTLVGRSAFDVQDEVGVVLRNDEEVVVAHFVLLLMFSGLMKLKQRRPSLFVFFGPPSVIGSFFIKPVVNFPDFMLQRIQLRENLVLLTAPKFIR